MAGRRLWRRWPRYPFQRSARRRGCRFDPRCAGAPFSRYPTLPVDISLAAWATSIAAADAMAGPMLAAALGVFVRRDVIDLAAAEAAGLLVQLLAPLARLASVERGEDTRDTTRWLRTTIRLVVRGRLELMLAAEARETEGVI